ncbi:MAG: formate/nitrite transporter family protein [Nitrososphaera sp.]
MSPNPDGKTSLPTSPSPAESPAGTNAMSPASTPPTNPSQATEAGPPPAPPRLLAGIFGLPDTLKTVSNLGVAKCKLNPAQGILMGWQSMSYLAFAALFAFIIMAAVSADLSPGLGRFLMFVVFPGTSLVAVIIFGANLVTGDYMTSGISLMSGQAKWREVFYQWSITHSGHWIAGVVIGWMIIVGAAQLGPGLGPLFSNFLVNVGNLKVNVLEWDQLFWRAIFANWMVTMAVWGAFRTQEVIAKILLISFPLGTFFATGFEHSIVNHWVLSAAIWQGASYTWGEAMWNNLVPVTLGNIVGATFFMGMVYWYTGGMQTWLGQDKWRQPHGLYRDLGRALKDTITLMFAFTAIMPAAIGAILLFGIEPAMGIAPGTNNPNWVEPIIAMGWFVGLSLIVKWFLWPRKPWYKIPAT